MRSQEIAVYREIQRNTSLAMKTLDVLSEKVYDEKLSGQLSREVMKYSELHNLAVQGMLQMKLQPDPPNHLAEVLKHGAILRDTLLNNSTGQIAKIMMEESYKDILDMNRLLNHYTEAGEKPKHLVQKIIEFENKNLDSLKKYL